MRKHFDGIAVLITIITVGLTLAFVNGESLGLLKTVDADSEAHSDDTYFTESDLNGNWSTAGATSITLEGDTARVVGGGAYVWNGSVYVANSGAFVVRGTLTGGSIVVDAKSNSKVWILLDGVSITNDEDACLIVSQADKVFLTLAEGSTNTLTSGDTYSEEALADLRDGAVFARDDLTINGEGSLVVSAAYKHGIAANDDLVIAGGNLEVDAPQDGIHANDSLRICRATLNVSAGDDGMAVDEEDGYLYVESGDINIQSEDEGMVAAGDVTVAGGSLVIATDTERGHHGIRAGNTCTVAAGTVLVSSCYEGITAPYIDVVGGDITVYPADDGLNASLGGDSQGMGMGGPGRGMGGQGRGPGGQGGGMGGRGGGPGGMGGRGDQMGGAPVEGEDGEMGTPPQGEMGTPPQGEMGTPPQGEAGDMGVPADMGQDQQGDASINEDDAASKQAGSEDEDRTSDQASDTLPWIHVSGGSITIINDSGRDADGLDSNGDLIVTGGDIRISLVGDGSNSAIDYGSESGGVCQISGGTVVACGASGMAEGFDSGSTQCSLLYNFSAGAPAGTTVMVRDSNGNVLLSYEVPCSFTSVNLSCPQMTLGSTYEVVIGDLVDEVTLSDVACSSGDTQSGGFGGAFTQGGGMRPASDGGVRNNADGGGIRNNAGDGVASNDGDGAVPSDGRPQRWSNGRGARPFGEGDGSSQGGDRMPGDAGMRSNMIEFGAEPTDFGDDVTDANAAETADTESYTTETLVICAISTGVLVFGLIVARLFRRHF